MLATARPSVNPSMTKFCSSILHVVQTLLRRDLQMEPSEATLEVIATEDIRSSVAVPMPGETEEERKRRDEVFFAVLDVGSY